MIKIMDRLFDTLEENERIELGKALAEELVDNGLVAYDNGFDSIILTNEQAIEAIDEWCLSEGKDISEWLDDEDIDIFYLDYDLCLYDRESILEEIGKQLYDADELNIRRA